MKIAIIGTGYVGLPTGAGFASLGHDVVCIDREISKIEKLRAGEVTLYEDGLAQLLKDDIQSGHINFTTSMKEGVTGADIVIIAVGTPPHPVTHEADLKYLYAAATELSAYLNDYTVVANKSTVPVGTGDSVEGLIRKTNPKAEFDVISMPEFLREGYAVYDFFHPDRIVVGVNTTKAKEVVEKLYAPLLKHSPETVMLYVQRRSAETIKYASNSFLAAKIHFINEMANFCEEVGANIYEVAHGMGLDKRIGKAFLNPGPGFGGSCFPKDTMAMDFMARQNGITLSLVKATIEGNNARIQSMSQRVLDALNSAITSNKEQSVSDSNQPDQAATPSSVGTSSASPSVESQGVIDTTGTNCKANNSKRPCVGVLGLAFKHGTDDCRVSPAMQIIEDILQKSEARLQIFDPQAMENGKELLKAYLNRIEFCQNALDVTQGADVLAVLTEWPEFTQLDLKKAKANMRSHYIVDCRNMLKKSLANDLGFNYRGIGL